MCIRDRRSIVLLAPRKVWIRAVFQQPTYTGVFVGPAQDVTQRRHATRDAIDVQAKAMQQFERGEIAATRGDVRRDTVCRIRSAFQKNLREWQVAGRA